MTFPSGQRPRAAITGRPPASLVIGSATAHRNDSLQSRRNKTIAGILEDQSDGDGGA
jgi:hypothetical protein